MKKNLRNGVRFLKIFLGDTNHDEALSNSDSIRKNLDGNDAEKYTLLKRWTECNTHCYWLLAAIYQSTLQGWRYTLISFPLVWPVARVPRFVLLSYCNCFKVVCDLQLNRPIKTLNGVYELNWYWMVIQFWEKRPLREDLKWSRFLERLE